MDNLLGCYVRPDNWPLGNILAAGLDGFCSYYLPTNSLGPIKSLAVNLMFTGKVTHRREGGYYRRARLEFVGDGEPNTYTGAWVACDFYGNPKHPSK